MTLAGAGLLVETLVTSLQAPRLADAFDSVLESLTARPNRKPQESGQCKEAEVRMQLMGICPSATSKWSL
jgi:hypothetical protein